MVRIAIRTITFNCLRGLALREPSRVVKDDHCFQFMSQPEPQRYFRQLVYYIISLIITMNNLCKDKWLCSEWMTASNYKDAYSLAQTVCDEFYILHDLMNCGVPCVTTCLQNTLTHSLLENVCFPAILNQLHRISPISTQVHSPMKDNVQYTITHQISFFVLSMMLIIFPSISFPYPLQLLHQHSPILTVIESFFLQSVDRLPQSPPVSQSSSPASTTQTIMGGLEAKPIPLVSVKVRAVVMLSHSPRRTTRGRWSTRRSTGFRARRT